MLTFLGVEQCAEAASKQGYKYFAMQHNHYCFGSNDYIGAVKYGAVHPTDCMLRCTGAGGLGEFTGKSECGGGMTNALYEVASTPQISSEIPILNNLTVGSRVNIFIFFLFLDMVGSHFKYVQSICISEWT